jgi:hypothetical protein
MSIYPTVDLLKMKSVSTVVSHRVLVVEEEAEQVAVTKCQVDAILAWLAEQMLRSQKHSTSNKAMSTNTLDIWRTTGELAPPVLKNWFAYNAFFAGDYP